MGAGAEGMGAGAEGMGAAACFGGVETANEFIPGWDSAANADIPASSEKASMPGRVLFIAFIK